MGRKSAGLDLTASFSALDHGEAGIVVTVDAEIADWADRHGYVVRAVEHQSGTVYEISPGDARLEDPTVPLD